MNKDRIILKIKELYEKIDILNQQILSGGEDLSSLDLDTQLMYMRMLYDNYLLLRRYVKPTGKSPGMTKGKKEKEKEAEEEAPAPVENEGEVTSTLPLLFAEEAVTAETPSAAPSQAEAAEAPEAPETATQTEEAQEAPETPETATQTEEAQEAAEAPETATQTEEAPEAEVVKAEETESVETPSAAPSQAEAAEAPEAPETATQTEEAQEAAEASEMETEAAETSESEETEPADEPAIDLSEYDSSVTEFDMDAIEFELEDDEDLEDLHRKPTSTQEDYPPYYPGLNPRAMNGELEDGAAYTTRNATSIGEHFANQFPSLNDQLSQKRGDKALGERMQREQISDLTKSIDLNIKFLFIKELFKGDATLLTSELQNLNRCQHLEKALAYFEDMKMKYHWKEDNEAVNKLYELILRKYAK